MFSLVAVVVMGLFLMWD
jgi:hypothetical protein